MFKNLDKNHRCSLIKNDIREFYPLIREKAVKKALELTILYIRIPKDKWI